jgi:hypothetical protein
MNYLVEMKVTDAGRPKTEPEGIAFIDQYIIPSLEMCKQWQSKEKIVVGGPIGGLIEIVMFFDVESIHELDGLLEQLPIWPLMNTRVKQIIAFDDLLANVRSRSEQLKTKSPEARPSNGSVSHSVAGKMVLPMMRAGTWQHSSGVVLC